MLPRPKPIPILCVASGKGGVGKTTLTLSLANEVGRQARVLVVDLDYFNRGVSGMLLDDATSFSEGITFLLHPRIDGSDPGVVRLVVPRDKPAILVAPCEEMSVAQMQQVEKESPEGLRARLVSLIEHLVDRHDIQVVILDAHGGPDALSFCAVTLATHTILVSDPDKVTIHGTFNFLARLEDYVEKHHASTWPVISLLFNRVSSAFSYKGLLQLYREGFDEWLDQPLLGVVPFQPDIFDGFANAPFITDIFPGSLFAKKIQLLLFKLLAHRYPELLSPEVLNLSSPGKLERQLKDFSLFRPATLAVAAGGSLLVLFGTALFQAMLPGFSGNEAARSAEIATPVGYAGLAISAFIAGGIWLRGVRASMRLRRRTFFGKLYRWHLWTQLSLLALVALVGVIILGGAFSNVQRTSQDKAILNNLRMLAAASDQYFLENDVREADYDRLVGPQNYIKAIHPIVGENYRKIPLVQGYVYWVRRNDGTLVEYDSFFTDSETGDSAIKENLRRLASARDTYFLERGTTEARFEDLVGPEPTKYIKSLTPVAGEDYRGIIYRKGVKLNVRKADGTEVEYER